MTDVYEFSQFDRQNLIYNFANMTAQEIAVARDKLKQYEAEQAAKKAAVAAQAKVSAPSAPTPPKQEPPAQPTGN